MDDFITKLVNRHIANAIKELEEIRKNSSDAETNFRILLALSSLIIARAHTSFKERMGGNTNE